MVWATKGWNLPRRARLLGALLALSACAGPEDQAAHLTASFDQASAGLRAMQAGRQPWDAPPPAPPNAAALLARATLGSAPNTGFPGGPPGSGFTAPAPGPEATALPGATRLEPAVPQASFPAAREMRPGAPLRAPVREASTLLGVPAETVLATLGEPELRRPEGDSEAWLYRGQRCLLDVVLYPDPVTRRPRVGHAAARSAGVARVTEEVCLSDIAQGRVLARLR
jgi:hypothetical protein